MRQTILLCVVGLRCWVRLLAGKAKCQFLTLVQLVMGVYVGYYYHACGVPILTASMRLGPLDAMTRRHTGPPSGCIVNCDVVQRANTSTQQPH